MIEFKCVSGRTTLSDEVKFMTFEELKEKFEGVLDYVSLAEKLGIKPTKKAKVEKPKDESKQE